MTYYKLHKPCWIFSLLSCLVATLMGFNSSTEVLAQMMSNMTSMGSGQMGGMGSGQMGGMGSGQMGGMGSGQMGGMGSGQMGGMGSGQMGGMGSGQMGGMGSGQMGGMGSGQMGGMGSGQMGGMGSGQMGGMGNQPGTVHEICHMGNDMPPHYCEPSYHVMSSVLGIRVSDVSLIGNQEIMVTLQEWNNVPNGTRQGIVIVGGGGDLAGATLVNASWKDNTTASLRFVGTGSVYNLSGLHLHLFPYTQNYTMIDVPVTEPTPSVSNASSRAYGSTVSIVPGSASPNNGKYFVPETIAVSNGTTVTWTNQDTILHTVTSGTPEGGNSGTEFDSSYIAEGKTFQHTFSTAGTFDYYCTLHPFMKGKVTVS